jgi:flagellar basal-body rod protein FlgB
MASFDFSVATPFIESALNARAIKQDMISSNIANVDTPGYRPRDLSFENALKKESDKVFGRDNTQKLEMAKTDGMHLDPISEDGDKSTVFIRDGHLARNDGNSVDIDVETTEMAKNSTMYTALINAYKKDSAMFSAVIDSSKSTQ